MRQGYLESILDVRLINLTLTCVTSEIDLTLQLHARKGEEKPETRKV